MCERAPPCPSETNPALSCSKAEDILGGPLWLHADGPVAPIARFMVQSTADWLLNLQLASAWPPHL